MNIHQVSVRTILILSFTYLLLFWLLKLFNSLITAELNKNLRLALVIQKCFEPFIDDFV